MSNNTTSTPNDVLNWVKAEENRINIMDAIDEAEKVLKSFEQLEKTLKLAKEYVKQVESLGIE